MDNGQEPQLTIADLAAKGSESLSKLGKIDKLSPIERALLVLERAGVADLLHERDDLAQENGKLEECLFFAVQALLKAQEILATGAAGLGNLSQGLETVIGDFRDRVEHFGQEAQGGQEPEPAVP